MKSDWIGLGLTIIFACLLIIGYIQWTFHKEEYYNYLEEDVISWDRLGELQSEIWIFNNWFKTSCVILLGSIIFITFLSVRNQKNCLSEKNV